MSENLFGDSGTKSVSESWREVDDSHLDINDLFAIFSEWSTEDIIAVRDGLVVFANKKFSETVGKKTEEILGTSFLDYFTVDYRRMVWKKYEQRIKDKVFSPAFYEVAITDPNGFPKLFDLSAYLITLSGKLTVLISLRSIDERKPAEEKEAERKFRTIFEKTPVGIVYFDKEGLIRNTNEAFRENFNFLGNNLPSRSSILDLIPDTRIRDSVLEIMGGTTFSCSGEYQLKSGNQVKSIKLLCNSFLRDGQLQGGIGVFEDITLQKTAEKTYYYSRKRLELLLELSQMEYIDIDYFVRKALEKAVDFTSNKSGMFYFPEKLPGLQDNIYSTSSSDDPDEKENIVSSVKTLFSTNPEGVTGENIVYIPVYEGENTFFVAGFDKTLPYTDVEQRFLKRFIQDIWLILQRRLSEQALQASEMKYSTLVEKGNNGIVIIRDGILSFVNSMFCELVGMTSENLIGAEFSSLVSDEYRRMVRKKFSTVSDQSTIFHKNYEIELLSKNGQIIPVEISSSVIYHEDSPAIMAVVRDITKQKAKETELLEALDALKTMQSVIRTSPAIVFFWAPKENWPVEFVSENIENLGYTPDDFLSGKMQYGDIIHPSDVEKVHRKVNNYSEKGVSSYNIEYRIITKSGEIRWVEERTSIHYDNRGRINHYQGLILDITERKRASSFLDIETDVDQFFSPAGNLQDIFNQLLDLALHIEGIDCGALYVVDKTTGDLNLVAHKEFSDMYVSKCQSFERKSLAGRFMAVEYPTYKLFSELYPLFHGKNVPDKLLASAILPITVKNRLVAVLFVSSHKNYDITFSTRESLETVASQIGAVMSRVRKEAYLNKNQHDLQLLFDTIEELVFVIDTEGCIVYNNRKVSELFGFSKEELTGMNFIKLHSHDQVLDAVKAFKSALQGSEIRTVSNFSDKNGHVVKVELSIKRGEWNNKKVVIIVGRQAGV